jgi:ATP-dependent phosphoenolpyruvate carboxykinase
MHAIHDPTYQPRDTAEALGKLKMAPRLDKLDGKTVYLVNTGFAGGKEFIEELDGWFKRNKPAVKTVVVNKKTSMFTDDPELWVEIKKNADGVVFGVGG